MCVCLCVPRVFFTTLRCCHQRSSIDVAVVALLSRTRYLIDDAAQRCALLAVCGGDGSKTPKVNNISCTVFRPVCGTNAQMKNMQCD